MKSPSIDQQSFNHVCPCCCAAFVAFRGTYYENDQPVGLYMVGLHHCVGEQPLHAAISVGLKLEGRRRVATLDGWCAREELQFCFVDPGSSPWHGGIPADDQLSAVEARSSEHRELFLRVVDVIFEKLSFLEAELCQSMPSAFSNV